MLLSKSCMKEFNIKYGTIKLGTLHEYRDTEIKHIADPYEGYLTFNIVFDGTVSIPIAWFNALAGGTFQIGETPPISFPGKTSARLDELNYFIHDKENVSFKDSALIITRESLNGFVYCMSRVRKTRDCIDIFPEYDDYWFISETKARDFGVMLGRILRKAIITGRASGNHLVPESMPIDDFTIHLHMRVVEYVPRDIHITNADHFKLDDFMKKMSRIAFIKPPIPFQKEKEYRFNYVIISRGNIIEPTVKFTILDSAPLQELVMQIDLTDHMAPNR